MSSKLLSAIAVGIVFAFAGCSGGGSGTTAATPSTGGGSETLQTPAAALQAARAAVAAANSARTEAAIASARTALEAAVRRARAELDEAEGDAARSEAQAALKAAQDYQTEQTAALQRLQVVGSSPTAAPIQYSFEFPDWLITNVANARSALGGGTLNWDRAKMISEYSMLGNCLTTQQGGRCDEFYESVTLPYVPDLFHGYVWPYINKPGPGLDNTIGSGVENIFYDFQSIGKHSNQRGAGISFFQIRYKEPANLALGPAPAPPLSERGHDEFSMIVGISDHRSPTNNRPSTVIWIAKDRYWNARLDSDYYDPSGARRVFLRGGFISNEPYRGVAGDIHPSALSRGTYTGAMLGIKHDRLSAGERFNLDTFNHEYITGDATVTIALSGSGTIREDNFLDYWTDVNVEFSNIRNLNTGRPVEISKTEFEYRSEQHGSDVGVVLGEAKPLWSENAGDLNSFSCTACIRVHPGGNENRRVVSGGFAASDAFGVFAASRDGSIGRLFTTE